MGTQNENPEDRYERLGDFDLESFNGDLESHSDFFDAFGWPLFGEYDRYSLQHPITNEPWYISPREPTCDEEDPDYADWFEMALRYDELSWAIAKLTAQVPNTSDFQPETENVKYADKSRFSVLGNLSYLENHVEPIVLKGIKTRTLSTQFCWCWGEFNAVGKQFLSDTEIRLANEKQKRQQPGFNQKVWFCKSLENLTASGLSRIEAEDKISNYLYDLIQTESLSGNFNYDWFFPLLTKQKDGKHGTLKRTYTTDKLHKATIRVLSERSSYCSIPPPLG